MTVSIDGFDYINNGNLGVGKSRMEICLLHLTQFCFSLCAQNAPLLYNEIVCKTFTLTKVSFNTAQIITCAYDILEPLE